MVGTCSMHWDVGNAYKILIRKLQGIGGFFLWFS
jgi:hypothetical protein